MITNTFLKIVMKWMNRGGELLVRSIQYIYSWRRHHDFRNSVDLVTGSQQRVAQWSSDGDFSIYNLTLCMKKLKSSFNPFVYKASHDKKATIKSILQRISGQSICILAMHCFFKLATLGMLHPFIFRPTIYVISLFHCLEPSK